MKRRLVLLALFAVACLAVWLTSSRLPDSRFASPVASTPGAAAEGIPEEPPPSAPPLPDPSRTQRIEVLAESLPASAPLTGLLVYRGTVGVFLENVPIAGARVLLFEGDGDRELASDQTSPDGTFELRVELPLSILPCRVRLEAQHAEWVTWAFSRFHFAVPFLPLERSDMLLALHRGAEIRGRVTDLWGGAPVPEARVYQSLLEMVPKGKGVLQDPGTYSRGVTGPDGWFRARVPARAQDRLLLVEAEGFVPSGGSWDPEAWSRPLEIHLARPEEMPRLQGRVLDLVGNPVEGAGVEAKRTYARGFEAPDPVVRAGSAYETWRRERMLDRRFAVETDGEGRFFLPLATPDVWRVEIRKGGGFESQDIEVREGRVYECEIRFKEETVVFVGTVRARSTGLPIAGADVKARGKRSQTFLWGLKTGATGEVRLGPVPRESIFLELQAASFALLGLEVLPEPDLPETRFVVELDDECRVRGRLVDERGDALPGSVVRAGFPDPLNWRHREGMTDERGAFLIDGLPAGVEVRLSTLVLQPFPAAGETKVSLEKPGEVRDLGAIVIRRL